MCQPRVILRSHGDWGSCCCGIGFGRGASFRRFISKKEEKEILEEYMNQLKKELEGVEEHIQELKGK